MKDITKRFDRSEKDGVVVRLNQEDMCQALSVVPENKYEEDGGPGFIRIRDLLMNVTKTPILALREFAKDTVFNYLLSNCDAHGKNFALLYPDNNSSPILAPFYDLICTTIYPDLSRNMAMKIKGEKDIDRINRGDIVECGIVGQKEMRNILDYFISSLPFAFNKAKEELDEAAMPTLKLIEDDVMNRIQRL